VNIGLIGGLFIIVLLNILTVYGLQIYNKIADKVEKDKGDDKRVTSIQGML
jgi:cell division protein FtsW (lipid II flippase)